jgi:hypothetical protein
MSKVRPYLIQRKKAAEALREAHNNEVPQVTQCFREVMSNGSMGYCSLGVLMYQHGIIPLDRVQNDPTWDVLRIRATDIVFLNDYMGWSFDQIADFIENPFNTWPMIIERAKDLGDNIADCSFVAEHRTCTYSQEECDA